MDDKIEGLATCAALAADLVGLSVWAREEQAVWVGDGIPQAQALLKAALSAVQKERLIAILYARYVEHRTLDDVAVSMGLTSRERVRQVEAKAKMRVRHHVVIHRGYGILQDALGKVPVPGGPRDPAWISVKQGQALTGLSSAHLCYLVRTSRVEGRRNPWRKNELQILRESLRSYVQSPGLKGRERKGQWKDSENSL